MNRDLVHYIIVRKDMPMGVVAAQVAHVAAESAVLYTSFFHGSTVVVLEVDNQTQLLRANSKLIQAGLAPVCFYESSGPLGGQFTALGLVPCEREKVAELLKNYRLFNEVDKAVQEAYNSKLPETTDVPVTEA